MIAQYSKWPESRWTAADVDWKKAKSVTAGVDVGAVSSQAVVMCDGHLYCYSNLRTGADGKTTAEKALQWALEGTGMTLRDIQNIAATGFGASGATFAHKHFNEVTCHAKGARFMFGPSVRTVFDLGGQTSKAIKLRQWDRVADYAINDKCATSMGWGVELFANLIQVPIAEMGAKSLEAKQDPEPVSTTCYVFANTEAMGLLRSGIPEIEVLASYLFAIAWRLFGQIGRINPEKEYAFTGGLAKNPGIVKRLEREMGITALTSQYDPQLAGAIGAAILVAAPAKGSRQAASVKA